MALGYVAVMHDDRSVQVFEVQRILGKSLGDRISVAVESGREQVFEVRSGRLQDTDENAIEELIADVQEEHRLKLGQAAEAFSEVISECARDMLGCELAKSGLTVRGAIQEMWASRREILQCLARESDSWREFITRQVGGLDKALGGVRDRVAELESRPTKPRGWLSSVSDFCRRFFGPGVFHADENPLAGRGNPI